VLTYAFAVALAISCLIFASYKVIVLNGMENPPANMGLNFPPPKRTVITDDSIEVDSMTTRSVTPLSSPDTGTGRPLQPFSREAPVHAYRLLTVVDGVAFVELETFRGKDIAAVSLGAELRGAGKVELLERRDGRWVLVAGDQKLVSERQ
jgi:hypothetical protein